MLKSGSFENKDPENKDPKTHYKNEDPLRKRRPTTKTKTHYKNEDPLRKRRRTSKTNVYYENYIWSEYQGTYYLKIKYKFWNYKIN